MWVIIIAFFKFFLSLNLFKIKSWRRKKITNEYIYLFVHVNKFQGRKSGSLTHLHFITSLSMRFLPVRSRAGLGREEGDYGFVMSIILNQVLKWKHEL